jgi:3-oxoacyl-[acyl-carrier-protein] synthase II
VSNDRHDSIVITGAAMVTALGLTREQTWRAVRDGRCGMGSMTALETALPPEKLGGQAPDLPADYRPNDPREVRYLAWTIRDALREAGVAERLPYAPGRHGIMLGTTLHGMRAAGQYLRSGSFEPLRSFLAGQTLARAVAGLEIDGFAATTCSACSSSLGAIALAITLLRSGELDLVIAGGYDTISEYVYGGFNSLRLVADGPLRPFAKDRAGMKLAEGYGIVVLERAADARRRGAPMMAAILGCGESADAHHLTQPHPQGDGAARAINAALRSAGLTPAEVDLVAAHATGTPDNDAGEYAALARVFGEHDLPRVPVVAFKSHLGHTLGGAGAVELILSAMALRDQTVPPCANSTPEAIEFRGLNLSTGSGKPARIRATLNTSLGFGGANTAAIVASSAPARPSAAGKSDVDVLVTGIGVIVPGAVGAEAFVRLLDEPHPPRWSGDSGAIAEADYLHLLNARRVRRMSEYVKLTLAATNLALADANLSPDSDLVRDASVILGTTHGSADFSATYYREIVRQGFIGANPVLFAEGVPNAAAAHLSLMLGLRGACQTIIGSRTSGLDALHLAAARIRRGEWERAIVGAGEEYSTLVNDAYAHCGLHAGPSGAPPSAEDGFVTGAAAVTFVLESRAATMARHARPRGQVLSCCAARGQPGETIESGARVIGELGDIEAVMTSACGTWVDRSEAAALRRAGRDVWTSCTYGHTAEHFSATPLLGAAAVLLSGGRPPRLLLDACRSGGRAVVGAEQQPIQRFATLCTDFSGCVCATAFLTAPPAAHL